MEKLIFHPGETLVLNFTIPFSIEDVKAVSLSFRDRYSLVFEAVANAFNSEDEETEITDEHGDVIGIETKYKTRIGYTLNQEESLQFHENSNYKLQLNVYSGNGSRIASKEVPVQTLEQQMIDPEFVNEQSFAAKKTNPETNIKQITEYDDLLNKPTINGTVLSGNRVLPENPISHYDIDEIFLYS